MKRCPGCSGILNQECFNEIECTRISQSIQAEQNQRPREVIRSLVAALEETTAFVQAAHDEHAGLIEHYENGGSPVDAEYKQSVEGMFSLAERCRRAITQANELVA